MYITNRASPQTEPCAILLQCWNAHRVQFEHRNNLLRVNAFRTKWHLTYQNWPEFCYTKCDQLYTNQTEVKVTKMNMAGYCKQVNAKQSTEFNQECDEVRIRIRQRSNFEHFQQIRNSSNVISTLLSNANSWKTPCSTTDFLCTARSRLLSESADKLFSKNSITYNY